MSVTIQTPVITYTANGSVTSFPFPYRIVKQSDLFVYVNGSQVTTGFTVSGVNNPTGGSVVFTTPPASQSTIRLQRKTPLDRSTDYVEGGQLAADTLDADFDRLVMMIQDIDLKPLSENGNGVFDANFKRITNLGYPTEANDSVTKSYVDALSTAGGVKHIEYVVATDGQTVFNTVESFIVGSNLLRVAINGLNQTVNSSYTETSANSITFAEGLTTGDVVEFYWIIPEEIQGGNSSNVTYTDIHGISTNVSAKLAGIEAELVGVETNISTLTIDLNKAKTELLTSVSITEFNAVGDGVTDDTAAIQAAIDSLGASGGTVIIPNGKRCVIASNLIVKPNVSLRGPHSFVGTPANNASAPYGSVGGALLVDSSATITLKGGASLTGLLIHRRGMTFPAPDALSFAGTAITIGGDDAALCQCMILGFNKALYCTGYQRTLMADLKLDCTNGIEIVSSYDIPLIEKVHCWPFSTIAAGGAASTLQRTGTAFYLHDVADWVKLCDCFCYGYKYGFDINSVNTPTLVSCAADGTSGANVISGSRGFSIRGTTNDAKLIGCQAASQEIAFYCDTTSNISNHLVGCIAWAASSHGFYFGVGDITVHGGAVYNVPNGVTYTNVGSRVLLSGLYFGATNALPINITVAATTDKFILRNPIFSNTATGSSPFTGMGGTLTAPSIASAGQMNIPPIGEEFIVTGTTAIGNIHEGWAGRQITLVFSGSLTVVSGTGSASAIKLNSGSNFGTAANSTLTLKHNGTQWFEIGRSA